MQTNGHLSQDRYWLYVNDRTGNYCCLRDEKPYKLSVFITQEDGAAHVEAYSLMKSLRGHWVDKNEVLLIADIDFGGNLVLLEESDILLLKSRTEAKYANDSRDVPEG